MAQARPHRLTIRISDDALKALHKIKELNSLTVHSDADAIIRALIFQCGRDLEEHSRLSVKLAQQLEHFGSSEI